MTKKSPRIETTKPAMMKIPRRFIRLDHVARQTDTMPEAIRTGELNKFDFKLLQPKVFRIVG
jgi:hypothetical protein